MVYNWGVFVVGVLVIINECYKQNSSYVTLWRAEDVLSYYGTILGATVSVAVMSITILFTRKQIQRESYLKSESEKWTRIENIFSDILADIIPVQVLIKTMDEGFF